MSGRSPRNIVFYGATVGGRQEASLCTSSPLASINAPTKCASSCPLSFRSTSSVSPICFFLASCFYRVCHPRLQFNPGPLCGHGRERAYTPVSGALRPCERAPPPGCERPPSPASPSAPSRPPAPARAGGPPWLAPVVSPPRRLPEPATRHGAMRVTTRVRCMEGAHYIVDIFLV